MRANSDLWVVVPFYNEARGIAPTLHALLQQTDQDFALLLVDNASTDDTAAAVAAVLGPPLAADAPAPDQTGSPYRLIGEARKGTGAASDTGFRHAIAHGARFIARTDADCLPDPTWVARVRESLIGEGLEFVAGRIAPRDDDLPLTLLDRAILPTVVAIATNIGALRRRGPQFRYRYFMAAGNNLAITADLYQRAGGFPRTAIEEEHEDRALSERVRTLTDRARWRRDLVVRNSIRRLRRHGYLRTVLWYWDHRGTPREVDVR